MGVIVSTRPYNNCEDHQSSQHQTPPYRVSLAMCCGTCQLKQHFYPFLCYFSVVCLLFCSFSKCFHDSLAAFVLNISIFSLS